MILDGLHTPQLIFLTAVVLVVVAGIVALVVRQTRMERLRAESHHE